jgi:hypothetical protein
VRKTAHAISIGCLAALLAVYVAAKIDFFRRFDPHDVTGYLTGHWPFWVAGLVLAGISQVLAQLAEPPSPTTKSSR